MILYYKELTATKYVKGYGFLSFTRNLSYKYGKKLLNTVTNTGRDAAKTASKKVVHKTAEATGELIGKDNCFNNNETKTCV